VIVHGAGRRSKVQNCIDGTPNFDISGNILKKEFETSLAFTGLNVFLSSSNQIVDAANPVSQGQKLLTQVAP
jgi:hypothetical protein